MGRIALRCQCRSLIELILSKPSACLPRGKNLLGHIHHAARRFKPVVCNCDAGGDFFSYPFYVFFRFGNFIFAFTHLRLPLTGVKKIVAQMDTEGSKVMVYKRNTVLVAIPSEGRYVRNILGLGRRVGSSR